MQIEKEKKSKRDLEFLKHLSLEDHIVHLRPEHKKLLDIPEKAGMYDQDIKSFRSTAASRYLSPRSTG